MLLDYNGNPLNSKGTITLQCTYQARQDEFHVVDTHSTPLLGLQSCTEIDLVKITYALETKHKDENSQPFSIRKICLLTPKWRKAIFKLLIKGLISQNINRNQSAYA